MIIKSFHIDSFGGLLNRSFTLGDGVNVLSGLNESGKTSAAMFIKFILYGLSNKSKNGAPCERVKYINRTTGCAGGYMMIETDDGREYRLERSVSTSVDSDVRELVSIIDTSQGKTVSRENPGEFFFGVPEEVFINTCFVSESSSVRPDIGGVGSAIHNILTSADESIDLKKALRNLDLSRRELCHRNGEGGELSLLREKRDALIEKAAKAGEVSAEAIRISSSLDDIKSHITELEAEHEREEKMFYALERIAAEKKLDAARQTEERIEKMQKTLDIIDSSKLGREFSASLASAEDDIRTYIGLDAAYREASAKHGEDTRAADEVTAKAENLKGESSVATSVSIAMFFLAVLALAAAFAMYFFATGTYALPLVMTGAFAVIGILFAVKSAKASSKLNAILNEYEVDTTDELAEAVSDRNGRLSFGPDYRLSGRRMAEAKEKYESALLTLQDLCAAAKAAPSDDVHSTLAALHRVNSAVNRERSAITDKIGKLKGRLELLREESEGIRPAEVKAEAERVLTTPEGMYAASLDADGIREEIKKREFVNSQYKAALKRKSDLEEELLKVGKPSCDPSETVTEIDGMNRQIEELTLRHDACDLAGRVLREAGEALQTSTLPKIAAEATKLMRGASGHDRLTLDDTFAAGYAAGDSIVPPELLSRGTSDLSYIALRIAMVSEIFTSERPIVIFDESFSHIDDDRTKKLFRLMSGGQYAVLTCRNDDAAAAAECGARIIKL